MTKEKNLEYMKQLKEIGIPQVSKEYINVNKNDGQFHSCDKYSVCQMYEELYSNFNTDELLEHLPKEIEYKKQWHDLRLRFMDKDSCELEYIGEYDGELLYIEGESIRECIILAIIKLKKI